jgi:hypothetical protein
MKFNFYHTCKSKVSLYILQHIECNNLSKYIKITHFDKLYNECKVTGDNIRDYLPKYINSVPALAVIDRNGQVDVFSVNISKNLNNLSILTVIDGAFKDVTKKIDVKHDVGSLANINRDGKITNMSSMKKEERAVVEMSNKKNPLVSRDNNEMLNIESDNDNIINLMKKMHRSGKEGQPLALDATAKIKS